MLTVTDASIEYLLAAIGKIEKPKLPGACFRIVPMPGGKLTLTVGTPEPDDTEYERDGVTVLVLSEEMRARCEGRRLDAHEGNLLLT